MMGWLGLALALAWVAGIGVLIVRQERRHERDARQAFLSSDTELDDALEMILTEHALIVEGQRFFRAGKRAGLDLDPLTYFVTLVACHAHYQGVNGDTILAAMVETGVAERVGDALKAVLEEDNDEMEAA